MNLGLITSAIGERESSNLQTNAALFQLIEFIKYTQKCNCSENPEYCYYITTQIKSYECICIFDYGTWFLGVPLLLLLLLRKKQQKGRYVP